MAASSTSHTTDFGSEEALYNKKKSRLPDNTAFKQQKLPAWQPILTAKSILPGFFVIALIFIPLGAILLTASRDVVEARIDYTDTCIPPGEGRNSCATVRSDWQLATQPCTCVLSLNVPKDMFGNIYIYYGLSSFYQNHRRYVASRDDSQLIGTKVTKDSISQNCASFRLSGDGRPIAPCGAIANSMFNDTFAFRNGIGIDRTGIAWHTDHTVKFSNPEPKDNLTAAFKSYAQPLYWQNRVEELDPSNNDNNGYLNEALEVWMRTAAFPTFRKPYGKLNTTLLKAGTYNITVDYNFPVSSFGGTKTIILSTTSWLGGKNDFLGIAYIVVGALSLTVCLVLCIVHQVVHKKSAPPSPSSLT